MTPRRSSITFSLELLVFGSRYATFSSCSLLLPSLYFLASFLSLLSTLLFSSLLLFPSPHLLISPSFPSQYNGAGIWYFFALSLMEATTPFVNQHWYFTICNMKDSVWFAINGISMFIGFFIFRVVLTTAIMAQYWLMTWPVRDRDNFPRPHLYIIPVWVVLIGGLNYFWFYKITRGMLRMLNAKTAKKE